MDMGRLLRVHSYWRESVTAWREANLHNANCDKMTGIDYNWHVPPQTRTPLLLQGASTKPTIHLCTEQTSRHPTGSSTWSTGYCSRGITNGATMSSCHKKRAPRRKWSFLFTFENNSHTEFPFRFPHHTPGMRAHSIVCRWSRTAHRPFGNSFLPLPLSVPLSFSSTYVSGRTQIESVLWHF